MDLSLSKLREVVMDREAWRAAVQGVAESRTRLSDWTQQPRRVPPGSLGLRVPLSPPWTPSWGVGSQQLQQLGGQSPQRQTADALLVFIQSLANASLQQTWPFTADKGKAIWICSFLLAGERTENTFAFGTKKKKRRSLGSGFYEMTPGRVLEFHLTPKK